MKALKMLAALAVAFVGIAHAQTPSNTRGPFVQYNLSGGPTSQATTVFGSDWVHASGPAGPTGTATVEGQGMIGGASIGVAGAGTFTDSWAWSGWNDSIRVTTGLPDTTIRVWFWLAYDWSATVSGDASGYAYIDVGLRRETGTGALWQYVSVGETISRTCDHAGDCGEVISNSNGGNGFVSSFGDGVALFTFEMQSWTPYTLLVGMNAGVTGNDASVSVSAPSLRWGSLYLISTGEPFRVDSLSGFDYVHPSAVPETPTLALWGLGLAAWVLRRRCIR